MKTLTAANTEFAIAIAGLYPAPQRLKGYAADDVFSTESVQNAEVLQGIDGKLSGGYVFNPVPQTITLQADSDSLKVFNDWAQAQQAAREVLIASATIIIPSLNLKYACVDGYLTQFKPIPDIKRLVQPVQYQITWGRITGVQV